MRLTPEIVTAIQQLALEQRGLLGARAQWHVGDLAWNLCQRDVRENEWDIHLWTEEERLVAWSWLLGDGSGQLEHDVHPNHLHLLDEILANPAARTAFAFVDDGERRAALARHGFTQPGEPMHYLVRDVPERPEPPPLPTGFRYRTVGPDDVGERVSVHRDVWAPSRLTGSSYKRVRAQWPYRESLDCVIEAPDGRFAAYCLCWLDDAHGLASSSPSACGPNSAVAASARQCASSRSSVSTRNRAGRRSSTAPPNRRARSTDHSAFGSTPRSSTTRGHSRNIGV